MTFLAIGALAIALLVIVPLLAHLLQRGGQKPLDFPLVRLAVPAAKLEAQRRRFDDRWLFTLRALLVIALALLGAVPLVQCDRPSLTRRQGASVALAIVLDDSASMRAHLKSGERRFDLAKKTAERLISELRDGDVVSIVLAGRPARLLVGATPQLRLARQVCAKARESDRGTDLDSALELAESSLRNAPQVDHRVAVLSDLGAAVERSYSNLWLPLPQLTEPVDDCAVITASQRPDQVAVTIACTPEASVPNRKVRLVPNGASVPKGSIPAAQKLEPAKPVQSLVFSHVPSGVSLTAKLDGRDANPSNDAAPAFAGAGGTVIATISDYATARAVTGGAPLIEQALTALGAELVVRPWPTLPEEDAEYSDVSVVILDDPSTFGPELRAPLMNWVHRGGTAVAFLGASSVSNQLGMSLAPFVEGPIAWSSVQGLGLDPATLSWLGATAESWSEINARARLELERGIPGSSMIRGRWRDHRVAIAERRLGRGVIWTIGVPVSPSLSDLALRPAFMALLDRVVESAVERGLSPLTPVGHPWKLDSHDQVSVIGPDGIELAPTTPPGPKDGEAWYTPVLAGIHSFQRGGDVERRVAHIEPEEILATPWAALSSSTQAAASRSSPVETSPYVVGVLLALLVLELMVRSSLPWAKIRHRLRHRLGFSR